MKYCPRMILLKCCYNPFPDAEQKARFRYVNQFLYSDHGGDTRILGTDGNILFSKRRVTSDIICLVYTLNYTGLNKFQDFFMNHWFVR